MRKKPYIGRGAVYEKLLQQEVAYFDKEENTVGKLTSLPICNMSVVFLTESIVWNSRHSRVQISIL